MLAPDILHAIFSQLVLVKGGLTHNQKQPLADLGRYRLPAMDAHTVSNGKLLSHDGQSRAAFTDHMSPDGSWAGHAYA